MIATEVSQDDNDIKFIVNLPLQLREGDTVHFSPGLIDVSYLWMDKNEKLVGDRLAEEKNSISSWYWQVESVFIVLLSENRFQQQITVKQL